MNADGDDPVIDLHRRRHAPGGRPASVVESILGGAAAAPPQSAGKGKEPDRRAAEPPPEEEDGLDCDAATGDYTAFGRGDHKAQPSLVFILKDGSELGINYADLASASPDGSVFLPSAPGCKGNVIRLRIAGEDGGFFAIAEGLSLRRGWRMLMRHLTPWMHELPKGAALLRSDDPVIWSITFRPVKAAGGR